MRFGKKLTVLTVLVLMVLVMAIPAQAKKMKMVPKVDNIIFFQDYSGSMAMGHATYASKKIAMSQKPYVRPE